MQVGGDFKRARQQASLSAEEAGLFRRESEIHDADVEVRRLLTQALNGRIDQPKIIAVGTGDENEPVAQCGPSQITSPSRSSWRHRLGGSRGAVDRRGPCGPSAFYP